MLLLLPGPTAAAAGEYWPPCSGTETSLVDGLKAAGADASFAARISIAAANGIMDYRGTAEQNMLLLKLLKDGALRREAASPIAANAARVSFISQGYKTCKATAAAMAVNLLLGNDDQSTAGMGGSCCRSIEGECFTGFDGKTYVGQYRTDGYVGSEKELLTVMDAALAAGVPMVIPVHSTRSWGTKHHWVLLLGQDGADYRIADPACRWEGSVAYCATTLSERHYALGLADYDRLHYGWITFVP